MEAPKVRTKWICDDHEDLAHWAMGMGDLLRWVNCCWRFCHNTACMEWRTTGLNACNDEDLMVSTWYLGWGRLVFLRHATMLHIMTRSEKRMKKSHQDCIALHCANPFFIFNCHVYLFQTAFSRAHPSSLSTNQWLDGNVINRT